MANIIRINGGSIDLTGNAQTSDVLSEKTFYSNDSSVKQTGTMPNRGSWGTTINAGGSVTIPQGYHSGNGVVRANVNEPSIKIGDNLIGSFGLTGNNTTTKTTSLSPGLYGHFKVTGSFGNNDAAVSSDAKITLMDGNREIGSTTSRRGAHGRSNFTLEITQKVYISSNVIIKFWNDDYNSWDNVNLKYLKVE